MSKSARGANTNSERRLRRKLGMPTDVVATMPFNVGPPPKTCQWIEGEPSAFRNCKCGKPVKPGKSYCPEHFARATTGAPRHRTGFRMQRGWKL